MGEYAIVRSIQSASIADKEIIGTAYLPLPAPISHKQREATGNVVRRSSRSAAVLAEYSQTFISLDPEPQGCWFAG